MNMDLKLCFSFIVFTGSLSQVLGNATLSIQMISYRNTVEHDWKGKCCDPWCNGQCDTRLRFCLDTSNGDPDYTNTCSYKKVTTGEYKDQNNIDFSSDMIGARNPVEHEFTVWPTSGVLFKVYIEDDDSGHSGHDTIDKMYYTFKATPAASESRAVGQTQLMVGRRNTNKTELEVVWRVFCNQYYFGSNCTKYCKSANNELQGHYNCDPDNGNKICRPGWEDPDLNCKTFSDDCLNVDCQNGGQCIDGQRQYTCTCAPGFNGTHCESNINECANLPCQNYGTCVDGVNGYNCTCPDGYFGEHCELHICSVSNECENGGKCYLKDDGTTGCYCTQAYTGSKCSVEKCDLLDCKNGGTCDMGKCHCKYEYFGSDCGTNWCDVTTCLHGASCDNRTCKCTEGYTGKHCQTEINMCESDPCMNEGVCINALDSYECKCLPDYNGTHCEQYMEPIFFVGDTQAPPVDDESTDVPGNPTAQPVKERTDEMTNETFPVAPPTGVTKSNLITTDEMTNETFLETQPKDVTLSTNKVPFLVGGIVGFIFGVAVMSILLVFVCKRKRQSSPDELKSTQKENTQSTATLDGEYEEIPHDFCVNENATDTQGIDGPAQQLETDESQYYDIPTTGPLPEIQPPQIDSEYETNIHSRLGQVGGEYDTLYAGAGGSDQGANPQQTVGEYNTSMYEQVSGTAQSQT